MKKLMIIMTAGLLAGCCCDKAACVKKQACCKNPVIGNWSAKLPYDSMSASSLIFSTEPDGTQKAVVLYRWGSPEVVTDLKIDGNRFSFNHPYGQRFEGQVLGNRLIARIAPYDKKKKVVTGAWQPFEGQRNPAIACGVKTSDAKLGAPIDLLKDGLNGWVSMNEKANFGWKFKDGILSNALGGKGHGANLMTKRADFYDFNLEYDVRVPKNANSGVYLRGRFEIQVIDSYGKPVDCHNMAAYYGRVAPKVAVEKAPGEWQHVSVTLYREHLTVVLNGVTIIENAPVVGVTGGAIDANLYAPGPLYLQGDHSDADFKNMILRPAL